jgi:fatty-acyl-CoA synthase
MTLGMDQGTSNLAPWVLSETVGGVLGRTAALHPAQDALVFPLLKLRWSWHELWEHVNQAAAWLLELGVEPGEHVGIWSMNVPEWIVTQFAAGRIGAVLVNVNPAYRVHELSDTLLMADVTTLVVGSPFKGSNFVAMVESLCPEVAAASSREWTSSKFPRLKRLIALGERPGPGWWTWADAENGHRDQQAVEACARAVRSGDVHNIQFTSGTTGLPKGAMLTHRNVLLNAYYTGQRLGFRAADRVCVPVPFYHCFGCVLGSLVCSVYGSAIVVPAPTFDAGATLAAIDQERCTAVYGVPTMFIAQLEHPDFCRFNLTSLRTGIMSGAPCPLPLMQKVVTSMGIREICIGYGQTEASPIITFTSVDDPIEVRVGTVGHPIPGLEVKLKNSITGEETGVDETGELCVRGHCVMAGYYNNPEATAGAVDPSGWLHTGDLARRRADGNFRIVGRSKEMIIRGGENIYPAEIEEFLHHHPAVAEVAVSGVPDHKYGEVVAAWIVPKVGSSVTPEEVRAHCRDQIAYFKVPQYVMIVEHLPRTVTGKIRKHVLKEQAIGELGLNEAAEVETA